MKNILSLIMLLTLAVGATSCDDDDNNVAINDNVKNYINTHYPNAVIIEAEYKYNLLEVEIYDSTTKKDVYFNNKDVWMMTTWDIAINAPLPDAVTAAIATAYEKYKIDDVEYTETPDGDYYSIDLERGNKEFNIHVTPDGTIKL